MADIDLKTETPDTSLPTTGFLFGADSQAASAPSVYSTQTVATTLLGSTSLTGATITADAPVLNLSQTWNNAAVTFTGLKLNVTDTASAAASNLLDIGTGGGTYVSQFRVGKNGSFGGRDPGFGNFTISGAQARIQFSPGAAGGASQASVNFNGIVSAVSAFYIGSEDPASADVRLTRRGPANLRLGAADTTGTTAPTPQFLSAQSWASSTTNNQTGANFTIDGSQGTGTGAGGSIIFRVAPAGSTSNGVQNALATALTIASTGAATFSSTVTFGGNIIFPVSASIGNSSGNALAIGSGNIYPANNALSLGTFAVPFSFLALGTSSNAALLNADAANTLALRNGANAQAFRVYNTYTSATDFERGNIFWDSNVLKIGTEKGSAGGTARALEFQTDGTTRLTIASTGAATFTGSVTGGNIISGSAGEIRFGTRASMGANGNGYFYMIDPNNANAGVTLNFATNSVLQIKNVANNAYAALESASVKTDAPAGGTSGTWKLGVRVAATTTLDTTQYIEVDVGGTLYKLAVVTS